MGIVEVGDITPVVRCGHRVTLFLEDTGDQGMLAETRGAHQIEIVTLVVHSDPESDSLQGPLLADAGAQSNVSPARVLEAVLQE